MLKIRSIEIKKKLKKSDISNPLDHKLTCRGIRLRDDDVPGVFANTHKKKLNSQCRILYDDATTPKIVHTLPNRVVSKGESKFRL